MGRFIPPVGIVAVCTFALAAQPGAGVPKLLCVSNRTGNAEIFLADPDGENAVNLTTTRPTICSPRGPPTASGSPSRRTGTATRESMS
jgi:hypothetical protein